MHISKLTNFSQKWKKVEEHIPHVQIYALKYLAIIAFSTSDICMTVASFVSSARFSLAQTLSGLLQKVLNVCP